MDETIGVKGGKNDRRRELKIREARRKKLEKIEEEQQEIRELEKKVRRNQFFTLIKTLPIVLGGGVVQTIYETARKDIYLPTFLWVLENKVKPILDRLKEANKTKKIVLLDFTTNSDPFDTKKPLSHAYLIKAYVEGNYPDMAKPQTINNFTTDLFSCQD